ncbi:multiple inositol polyphosphate phosphatase 1-like [Actinia tenebrosa]|uniref:Multiple inositol polyphosphate phosphatase 1 n=1 Tax=Actinia tenebrosa TaxID=6105 RepID=A0A6P8HPZ8_ACTTE|nr:multiple inositol polyphosphate phosphatase 1-like [Actinia tenebrosa]
MIFYVLCFLLLAHFTNAGQKIYNFGSKTPYFYEESEELKSDLPSHCKAIHVNLLARHGTRHPSKKDVRRMNTMVKVVNELYKSGSEFKFNSVEFPWVTPFKDDNDKRLITRGEEELYNLSKRVRNRYKDLFKSPLSIEDISFVSTKTPRTLQSAMAFALGLMEGEGTLGSCKIRPVDIDSRDKENDPILRFFDMCPKYKQTVSKNKSSLFEHHNFRDTLPMMQVVERVRLKFGNSSVLTARHIVGMYVACVFENAVFERDNTWCSVFTEEDFEVLEYYADLKHYWKRGYGHDINHKMACNLLAVILGDIKNSLNVTSTTRKKGVFRFAHGETLQPLYCVLELFKEADHMRADNFNEKSKRLYRLSEISPFGANIAFVVYDCSKEESELDEESFQVDVLVNERPVSIPCCAPGKCSLRKFFDCFEGIAKNCNMEAVCAVKESDGSQNNHSEL